MESKFLAHLVAATVPRYDVRGLSPFIAVLTVLILSCRLGAAENKGAFELREGDRVVLVGDSLIENERHAGWIELMLTTRFPARSVSFRNLGWSADTPAGDSRGGLSQYAAGKEPPDEGRRELIRQIAAARATVIFVGYGMASSFAGEAGIAAFESDYVRLLDALAQLDRGIRCVLLGPIPHERLGPPWPNPSNHNTPIQLYENAVRSIAARRGHPFVSFFGTLGTTGGSANASPLTTNGIHLSDTGYRRASEVIEKSLLGTPGAWRTSDRAEALRQTIIRKNEWHHHQWRPNNFVYSFGFLKGHQGQHFRDEILSFGTHVAAEEAQIARLRTLTTVEAPTSPLPPARPAVPSERLSTASSSAPIATTTAYGLVIPRRATTSTQQEEPRFEVADGMEVTLWAKNPLLRKPIHMNFDPDGRLWIATSEIYPHLAPGQTASDKILVLEDSSGQGRADKVTVFADNLLIPTSVEPGNGGAYVTQSTDLIHLRDTDGDGKADVRNTVLRGFGTEDGHQVVHGLRWGPDGRLFLNQSVYTRSHLETPHGIVRHRAGGIFRLDPRNQRLEVHYRGWVNPWGHQIDNYGQSFVTDGADHRGINWGVPGATYNTLAPARRILESVSPGVYSKFIGIEIIRSRHFPDDWQGDVITCDFRAHTVVRFKLTEQGTAFVTKEMPPLLRSIDQHFRPLDVKLGPDGALYLADWSNPIIQHSGVDFREPRRDREHGRIWRIAAKGRAPLPVTRFGSRTNLELLDALTSPNSYDRERARRVLIERGSEQIGADLNKWIQARSDEEARLQALWLSQAIDRPNLRLHFGLLDASDHRIRAAAVRALPAETPLSHLAARVADAHPRVRLEAIRTLGRMGSAQALELALSALNRPMDDFLNYALWLTVNELSSAWLAAVKSGKWNAAGNEKQLEFVLKSVEPAIAGAVLSQLLGTRDIPETHSWIELIGQAGGPAELGRLYQQALRGGFGETGLVRALNALGDAARVRNVRPEGTRRGLAEILSTARGEGRIAAIRLAGEWKAQELATALLSLAAAPDTSESERTAVFTALRAIGGRTIIDGLAKLARTAPGARSRKDPTLALAGLDFDAALPDVLALLAATTEPTEAQALWRSVLGIPNAGPKISTALANASLPAEVARAGLRPAREGHRQPALVEVLSKFAGVSSTGQRSTRAELQALAQDAVTRGDAARGEKIYRRPELACFSCHAIGGAGGQVGPDLTGIGTSAPPDYLLESLLEPNAQIKQGYQSVLIETKDRQQLSGTVLRESADEVRIRDAAGSESIAATQNIVQRTNAGSLMPAGLIDGLLPDERRDLVKFLSMLGKPGDFNASQGGVARFWRLYAVVNRLQLIPLESITAGDFSLEDWMPVYSLTNGAVPREPLEAVIPTGRAPIRGLFLATQFHSPQGGVAKFALSAETKGLWVNGKPVTRGTTFTADTKQGVNVVVVQLFELDRARLPEAMKLTSNDVSFLTH